MTSAARFAVAWALWVAWAIATFTALERLRPRAPARPSTRRLALAAALLAVDAAIAQAMIRSGRAPIARAALAWVVAELLLYGVHRAMHRVPLLWRLHRLHHAPAPLTWVTAWTVHPIDAALFASAALLAARIAGAALPTAAWVVVGRRAWTVLLHANVAWPATRLDRVLATPAFHHRHHREDLAPANFASTLPLIDRLFGSYRDPRYDAAH